MEPTTLWGAHGEGTSMYLRDTEGNRVEVRYYP
jgi:catechol-2,3-dioxygenase